MSEQSHRSSPSVLDRRTLERDHRVLAAVLRPGMSVLDVGCGTGAITAGIAGVVGPSGRIVGVDRDAALLEAARAEHPGIEFVQADAHALDFRDEFDIVTAARALQWMADPRSALERMIAAVKPGERVVVLDYNHAKNTWIPAIPPEFERFYAAFLAWRTQNGWDNAIADHLPAMFEAAGLIGIEVVDSDEVTGRGTEESAIWSHVIDGLGAKFYADDDRLRAAGAYAEYRQSILERQTLCMRTIVGTRLL